MVGTERKDMGAVDEGSEIYSESDFKLNARVETVLNVS
jgi:hypothetical protein